MIFKFGKGKGSGYSSNFGGLSMSLDKDLNSKNIKFLEKLTLKQIAELLRKEYAIVNGEIHLFNIGFNFSRGNK